MVESRPRERRKMRVLQGHHGERQHGVEVLQRLHGTPKDGQIESQSCLPELASCPCPAKRNAHEPLANQGMCRSPSLHRHLAQHLGEPSELAAERKQGEVPKRMSVEPVTQERHRVGRFLVPDPSAVVDAYRLHQDPLRIERHGSSPATSSTS